jgi:hypothetical protein
MAGEAAQLLDGVEAYLRRWVVMGDSEATATALWVAHTYCFAAAETTPYLAVLSPTRRSGKSRLFEALEHIVVRPWRVADPTPSTLFRKIDAEQPTVMIDELDALHVSSALRAALNSGYRIGGTVPRTVREGSVTYVRDFNVFAPKALAGIAGARMPLHGTVLDRCIRLDFKRRTSAERVEAFTHRQAEEAGRPIRAPLQQFSEQAVPHLVEASPPMPTELNDRARECWMPLIALADLAATDWPVRARQAAVALTARPEEETDEAVAVVADCRSAFDGVVQDQPALFAEPPALRLFTDTLLARLRRIEEPVSEAGYGHVNGQLLARRLRPFGIKPRQIRVGDATKKGYVRSDFEDAWRRYLPVTAETPETPDTP